MRAMRSRLSLLAAIFVVIVGLVGLRAQQSPTPHEVNPTIKTLVGRLSLDHFKATLKGLTQFGDRRQGTKRNQDAVDWIARQLESYGYDNVQRVTYTFPPATRPCGPSVPVTAPPNQNGRRRARPHTGDVGRPTPTGGAVGRAGSNVGGSMMFGYVGPTGVNCDPDKQSDPAIRALDSQPIITNTAQDVYVTKIGTVHPDEMYIVGGHMDGHGYNQAANDDGSGATLVMELARVFASPDVTTDVSIRFVLWNGEEEGLLGSSAYVKQRAALQGKAVPPGSHTYPEPKWLGMIQHDMMMWDHGMPHADGKVSPEQRPEADINIEFQSASKMAGASEKLAFAFKAANETYATDYPAAVGPHMTNTDSGPFQNLVPSISLRENERGAQIGARWDPNWHQASDVYTTYSDKDFRLGLNSAQTTLAAIAQLTGAKISTHR